MKKYIAPVSEVIVFDVENLCSVLTLSSGDNAKTITNENEIYSNHRQNTGSGIWK